MAPNSGYYGTPFPGGRPDSQTGEGLLEDTIQQILDGAYRLAENIGQASNRDPLMTATAGDSGTISGISGGLSAEPGYPAPFVPVQGSPSTNNPAQTGMRPNPRIVGREEMVAENIKRALGRNRMMMAPIVPFTQVTDSIVSSVKELREKQALSGPAPTAAEDTGSISDVLGAPKSVYDPEQGRFVVKWDLGKIDPRYGLQSYEAIQSYLERMENQPQVAPRGVAAAAARQAPVSPAAARPSSPAPSAQPASSQAITRIGETPQEMLTRIRGGNLAPPNAWTRFVRYRPTSAPGGSVPAPGGAVSRAALSQMLNNLPPDAWARFVRPTNPLTTEK